MTEENIYEKIARDTIESTIKALASEIIEERRYNSSDIDDLLRNEVSRIIKKGEFEEDIKNVIRNKIDEQRKYSYAKNLIEALEDNIDWRRKVMEYGHVRTLTELEGLQSKNTHIYLSEKAIKGLISSLKKDNGMT